MKSLRRGLIVLLITVTFGLLALDFLLYQFDPIGIFAYFADYNDLQFYSLPAPGGVRYTHGTWRFRKYSVTIGLDGLRAVQNSNGGTCRIVFLGDSVVFGMGSDVSFVDYLAPDLPATVINAGIPAYSAANVAREIDLIPADGYIWLIIENDDAPAATWQRGSGQFPSATALYLGWLFPGDVQGSHDVARFTRHAAPLLSRPDVLTFAFEGMALTTEAQAMGAHVIPFYTHTVSQRDAHPSRAGAAEIADAMRDNVVTFEAQQCEQE